MQEMNTGNRLEVNGLWCLCVSHIYCCPQHWTWKIKPKVTDLPACENINITNFFLHLPFPAGCRQFCGKFVLLLPCYMSMLSNAKMVMGCLEQGPIQKSVCKFLSVYVSGWRWPREVSLTVANLEALDKCVWERWYDLQHCFVFLLLLTSFFFLCFDSTRENAH